MTTDLENSFSLDPFSSISDGPPVNGVIKRCPHDFIVDEDLGFPVSGGGDHVALQVRKCGLNTMDVVRAIERMTGIHSRDIGFCGLKDKQALTTQWFTVPAYAVQSFRWAQLERPGIEVLSTSRHSRKLRRGSHRGNRFAIKVREVNGNVDLLKRRLREVEARGVPNFFGQQRFGWSNIQKADDLFAGRLKRISRSERGILLSAARSLLFNDVLAARVKAGTWDTLLPGEVAMLDGSNSFFPVDEIDTGLQDRLFHFDIHPSGPLYGSGGNPVTGCVADLEAAILECHRERCDGLSRNGLRLQRRATRVHVQDLVWDVSTGTELECSFYLRAGEYATSVLAPLVKSGEHPL